MTSTAVDLVNRAQTLISMPDTFLSVQQLMDSQTSTIVDFSNVVQLDPGLSGRLLRIANSSFFGFPTSIETTERALNLMGIAQLHDLVLASSVIQASSKLPITVLNKMDFWRDSIHCAVLCRMIAQKINILESGRLFVAGLLHQLGYLIICAEEPEKAAYILDKCRNDMTPRHLVEQEILGVDYAQVGVELMRQWDLSVLFQETTEYQNNPEKAPQFKREATIVHLAQQIVHQINDGKKGNSQALNVSPANLDLLSLDAEQIESIKQDSKEALVESMRLLLTS